MSGRMSKAQHAAYINSPVWKRRRDRYFAGHPRRCTACGTAYRISLHHLDYGRAGRGREPDKDLMALCQPHHELAHTYERSGRYGVWGAPGTLRKATVAMVRAGGGRAVKPRRVKRRRNKAGRFVLLTAAVLALLIVGNAAVPWVAALGAIAAAWALVRTFR